MGVSYLSLFPIMLPFTVNKDVYMYWENFGTDSEELRN